MAVRRIYTALSGLGHTLDRAPGGSFYTLCQSYDFDRRGKIALDSFIAMVVLLENAKRLHAAFDPNRTGTASFDLNQVRSLPPPPHRLLRRAAPIPPLRPLPPYLPPHRPCPHSYGSDLCHLSLFGRSPCCRARHAPAPRVLRRHPRCGVVVGEIHVRAASMCSPLSSPASRPVRPLRLGALVCTICVHTSV